MKIIQNLNKESSWCFERIEWEIFLVSKVVWEHQSIEKFLAAKKKLSYGFFITEKFTKFDLALNRVGENHSKLEQRVFMMFRTIWQRDFFGVKSLMGTLVDLKIFRRKKKIQLQVRGQEGL